MKKIFLVAQNFTHYTSIQELHCMVADEPDTDQQHKVDAPQYIIFLRVQLALERAFFWEGGGGGNYVVHFQNTMTELSMELHKTRVEWNYIRLWWNGTT